MGYLNGLTGHPSGKKGHTGATGTRGARGPPGPDFNVMSDGNYDIQDKRLTKVSEGHWCEWHRQQAPAGDWYLASAGRRHYGRWQWQRQWQWQWLTNDRRPRPPWKQAHPSRWGKHGPEVCTQIERVGWTWERWACWLRKTLATQTTGWKKGLQVLRHKREGAEGDAWRDLGKADEWKAADSKAETEAYPKESTT